MQIPRQLVEYAIDPKNHRDALKHVALDKEQARLVATSGVILACVDVDPKSLNDDSSGLIPFAAMKEARKSKHFTMKVNGDVTLQDGRKYQKPKCEYPNIDNALNGNIPTRWVEPTIVIDPEKLYRLWKSIKTKESEGLCMWIRADRKKPIYVQTANGGGWGVLMAMVPETTVKTKRIKAHKSK